MDRGVIDIWNSEKFDSLFERCKLRISRDRAFLLIELLRYASRIKGDMAELGVYKGSTAYIMANLLKESSKRLYLFDTFVGTPAHSDKDNVKREGFYSDTSLEMVQNFLSEFEFIEYVDGLIPDTLKVLDNNSLAFCHIHLNLYTSTKSALEYIYNRVSKGGVILIEDYGLYACAGSKKACDEFVDALNISIIWMPTGQGVVIK